MAEEEAVDFSKLPLEARCSHKNWKARVSAYEELTKLFKTIDDEKSSEWSKYSSFVRKFPLDSNAAAQEKGLEATALFMENAHMAHKIVGEIIASLVTKVIGVSVKARSKELALQVCQMSVEIEKFEVVQEELMKGLEHKNPKVVSAAISILNQNLKDFGPKVINLKTLMKKIPPLTEDRDKVVREETKKLIVELYRWVGPGFKSALSTLKPTVVGELEAEFEKLGSERPAATRFLRSEQSRQGHVVAEDAGDGAEEIVAPVNDVVEIDPFELLEPVNILSKLPADFYTKCEEKKWQERKEALEKVLALTTANPKLETGDYAELVRTLKKMVAKDTNIVVTTVAIKCITGLASGLKKGFSPYATACISVILEKFKERKSTVVAALRDAIDACFVSTHLEAIQEDVITALTNKNPQVKQETALFLSRVFTRIPSKYMNDKKLMKGYFTPLLANLNEPDPAVRDATAEAFGVALKYLGEKTMAPYLSDVEPVKMTKIKEFSDKAVITASREAPKPKPVAKPASAPKAIRGGGKTTSPPNDNGNSASSAPSKSKEKAAPAKPPAKAKVIPPPAAPARSKKVPDADLVGSNLPVNIELKKSRFSDEFKLKILRWNFTTPREEFVDLLKDLMTTANMGRILMTQMFSSDFKLHIKAIDTLTEELKLGHEGTLSNLDLILKWTTLRFFDTNPSVLIRILNYFIAVFTALESVGYTMPEMEANAFIPYLINKLGDPKDNIRNSIHQVLRLVCSLCTPVRLWNFLLDGLKAKHGRQRAECMDEMTYMMSNYGIGPDVCQPNPSASLKELARQISDRDNAVRVAALNAIVQAYHLLGTQLLKMIGNLPEKDQQMLDERLRRVKLTTVNKPASAPAQQNNVTSPKGIISPVSSAVSPRAVTSGGGTNLNKTGPIQYQQHVSPESQYRYETNQVPGPVSPPSVGIGSMTITRAGRTGYAMGKLPEKYRIDYDYYLNMFGDEDLQPIEQLKLYDTNIDFLKNEPPLDLPRRSFHPQATLTSNSSSSSGNGGAEIPAKASQSIDLVVSQVGSADLRQSMEALVQLDSVICDSEVVNIMAVRVDHLLSMVCLQLRRLQPLLGTSSQEKLEDINKLYRCIVTMLTSLYKNNELAVKASKETLKDMVNYLLSLIVDPNVKNLYDAVGIGKQINVMVVRIIEKSDPNAIVCGLVRLLSETLSLNANGQLLELVMKCQWKLLKQLPIWNQNEDYEWDLVSILTEFHLFMKAHPFQSFNNKDVTPLKTMKTILHSLVSNLGAENISAQMSRMPGLEESEAGIYLTRMIQKELGGKTQNGSNSDTTLYVGHHSKESEA